MATATYAFTRGTDYPAIVATFQKVEWTVDEIFGDRQFDATNKSIPDSWVRTQQLAFLNEIEQLFISSLH